MFNWKMLIPVVTMSMVPTISIANSVSEQSSKAFLSAQNVPISDIEMVNGRMYKKKGKEFPWQAKCTKYDYRTFHGCLETRFFEPSARVYFDSGNDQANELDLFHDGGLNATIEFVSVYLPWRLGRAEFYDAWAWGPIAGVGISSPAQDSQDGSQQASGAPVVLASYGLLLEYEFGDDGGSFGFEIGGAAGFSADESLGNNKDTATYVGLRIEIPTSSRNE